MCGITGYVGTQDALPLVVRGLRQLEYRGYDSAGVALRDDGLSVYKQAGRVDDLDVPESSTATCGIGHTRWSTHGRPTDENAHPHTDCTGDIAVVHNGIIGNYDELKAQLSEHTFRSQTDTEVIAHLLEEVLPEAASLRDAVEEVVARLEGSYALAVIASDHDGIVCARRNSPLVLGHAENGTYVASDVTAFLDQTRSVTYLEDGDVAELTAEGVVLTNEGQPVDRPKHTVEWDAQAAEKGGYKHYMLKEIHEQPDALRQAIAGRIDTDSHSVDIDPGLGADVVRDIEEIQLVACGTSYHASLYAKYLLQELADVRATVEVASEYEFEGGRDPSRTLVVGVTQSGETADTLQAVRRASAMGARTLGVTNTLGSTITREVDASLFIRAGPEIGVAATKTFSSQVVVLSMLAHHIGATRGTLTVEAGRRLIESLSTLPTGVDRVLNEEESVVQTAHAYADEEAFFYIGRRAGTPVALEGALKLKEISYDHAEGFPAGELKHGPLALVSETTPVLALLTDGGRPTETRNNVKEVQSRGAPVIAFASDAAGDDAFAKRFDVPDIGTLEPLLANVYLQLFAYYVADAKDRPIDKPRNLAKSVTVE
jgi:glucosamine--fructose-6-phosphate aminotransferase (isomerizing)